MGRVLCVSSQTVYGPVGNSAAVPALQAEGHEVMALPTVVLSNHPGHGPPAGQATPSALLEHMLARLAGLGALDGLDAVMTGYFANAAQVIAVAKQITSLAKRNQALHVLVDPVIGDHGALYVQQDVAEAIRDHLLPLATITTPNLFELTWLSGLSDIGEAVESLNVAETIVTSVPVSAQQLATQLFAANRVMSIASPKLEMVPNGTGDFLAGSYLAFRLNKAENAFEETCSRVQEAIRQSAGGKVLYLPAPGFRRVDDQV